MKNISIKISLFLAILFCTSCGDDFFTTVIELDLPEHTPKLVLHSYGDTELPFIGAFVGRSMKYLDQNRSTDFIENALVLLSHPSGVDTLYSASEGRYAIPIIPGLKPITPSTTYTMSVSAPGFESISATQTTPKSPDISTSTFFNPDTKVDIRDDPYHEVTVTLNDEKDVDNYYMIQVKIHKKHNPDERYNMYTWTDDVRLQSYPRFDEEYGLLLKDNSFENGSIALNLKVQSKWINLTDDEVHVHIESMTADKYNYIRSLDDYERTVDNPFAEPVIITSNVEGGFGIFALGSIGLQQVH